MNMTCQNTTTKPRDLFSINNYIADEFFLSEENLAKILKNQEFVEKHSQQIYSFFLETDTLTIYRFCKKHGISLKELKSYYEKFIKKHYKINLLEEFLDSWKV